MRLILTVRLKIEGLQTKKNSNIVQYDDEKKTYNGNFDYKVSPASI